MNWQAPVLIRSGFLFVCVCLIVRLTVVRIVLTLTLLMVLLGTLHEVVCMHRLLKGAARPTCEHLLHIPPLRMKMMGSP